MISSTSRRGGFAAVGLATLALAGCGTNATHQAAAGPPPATAATAGPPPATAATAAAPSGPAATPDAAPAMAAIGERSTSLGKVLVDARGHTLYTYALDGNGMSACSGACAAAWPPDLVTPGESLTGQLRLPGRAGMIARAGGQEQATYDGHPLYTFKGDTAAGQTHGAGLKGVWFAVAPDGKRASAHAAPILAAPAPAPAPAPTMSRMPAPAPSPTARPMPRNTGDGDADNFGGPDDGDGNR